MDIPNMSGRSARMEGTKFFLNISRNIFSFSSCMADITSEDEYTEYLMLLSKFVMEEGWYNAPAASRYLSMTLSASMYFSMS